MSPVLHSVTESCLEHILRFVDQLGSFLEDNDVNLILDGLITRTNFSNNEIQEDNASECNNDEPYTPEHSALEWVKYLLGIKLEVTHRNSQNGEEVAYEVVDVHVLFAWICDSIEKVSDCWVRALGEVSQIKD